MTTPGFIEASANAAREVAEIHVMSLQRFIKRIVEQEIFVQFTKQSGFDYKQTDYQLKWWNARKARCGGITSDARKHSKDRTDIFSAKEFRKILVDMGLALEKAEEPIGRLGLNVLKLKLFKGGEEMKRRNGLSIQS